jgi:alanyl-tRNA synthetase
LLLGKQIDGSLNVQEEVVAEIDKEKRDRIKLNHSATHLLHSVLRNTLGENVMQKGSLVSDEKLRFDFSADKPIDKLMLRKIEGNVNSFIDQNIKAETKLMSKEEALESGAIALFGEKYDDEVRVLSFDKVSVELCGGTHVNNTGDIGVFKILSESSVSSGTRRIEAITGMAANDYLSKRDDLVSEICQLLNTQDNNLLSKIDAALSDNKKLKKENLVLLKEINNLKILDIINNKQLQGIYNVHVINQDYVDGKVLKNILEDIKSSASHLVLTIIQKNNSKLEIYSLVTKDCSNVITAKEIINMINTDIGSTGGGRDDLAQAGLEYNGKVSDMVTIIENNILQLIQSKES